MTNECYIVGIEDLFRVPADKVSSEEEAEQYVIERIGEEGWIPFDAAVVDKETMEE